MEYSSWNPLWRAVVSHLFDAATHLVRYGGSRCRNNILGRGETLLGHARPVNCSTGLCEWPVEASEAFSEAKQKWLSLASAGYSEASKVGPWSGFDPEQPPYRPSE